MSRGGIKKAPIDDPLVRGRARLWVEDVLTRKLLETFIPWMALRRVVREIKLGLPGTPEDPRPAEVASDDAALEWLRQSDYPAKLEKAIHQKWTYLYVQKLLRGELERTRQTWEKDEWVTDFSGKEIVARLRSPAVGFAWMGGVAASDESLAVAVAQRWRQHRAIPAWITTLRDGIQKASAP